MTTSRDVALELLQSPHLFTELLSAVRKRGLVGEERNALVVYVVATSRLLQDPLCLLVKGPSGVGKNFLTDTVLGFVPPFDVQQLTSSSTRSWNYLGKKLAHKVVYVKERNEETGSVRPTRLLISERELVHIVTVRRGAHFVSERRVTEGPIAAISTTTQNRVEVDDETRHLSIWLDESREQTERIMQAAVEEKHPPSPREKRVWHKVQQLIQKRAAVPIELPEWFRDAVQCMGSDDVWARRYIDAFLQACRTVALIRSFRRNEQAAPLPKKILVRFTDFAITTLIFNVAFERSLDRADEIDLETQRYVQGISARKGGRGVRASELAEDMGVSVDRAYTLLRNAAAAGSISQVNRPLKTNVKLYLPTKPRPFLPDPAEVFQRLQGLPERVKFVHPLEGRLVAYSRERNASQD